MGWLQKHPVVRGLLLAALAAVFGINVYALNAARLAGNQVPMPFGVGASVVLSGSMEPTLSVGDLLLLTQEDRYTPGQIVVYQDGNAAVVHRLLALEGETAQTRGDANNSADAPIPASAIKGRVVLAIPLLGHLMWALKTPLGIMLTLGAAVALMELSFRREKAQKMEEMDAIKAEIRKLQQELQQEK